MGVATVGELVKQMRKAHHMTAEDLAFAAECDVTTLSKIENNKSQPSRRVFDNIIRVFGHDPNSNYDIWVMSKDYKIFYKMRVLGDLIYRERLDEATQMICNMEKEKPFAKKLNLQFLLLSKAQVGIIRKDDSVVIKELALQGLSITRNPFNERQIEQYFLSQNEVNLINVLGISFSRLNEMERAINILQKLKQSIEKSFESNLEDSREYTMILYNLTKYLGLSGQHEKVIEICKYARELCIKYNDMGGLADILMNYSYALYYIGDYDTFKKYVCQAYVLYLALEQRADAKILEASVYNRFQIDINSLLDCN